MIDLRSQLLPWADAPDDWEPTWIIENIWQFQGVNFLAGPPKRARKSSLRRYLTACAISGESAFGLFPVHKPAERVLSIIVEDHPGMEKRAIKTALAQMGHTKPVLLDFLQPLDFRLNNPAALKELCALIDAEGYELLTLDPLVEFHSADENSASEMGRVALALRELAKRTAVCVMHHTTKPPQDSGFSLRTLEETMRGSGVLGGCANVTIGSAPAGGKKRVRLTFSIKTPKKDEPDATEVMVDYDTWTFSVGEYLTEESLLKVIANNPDGISGSGIQELVNRKRYDVLKLIKELERKGLVRHEGDKRGRKYYPV